MNNHLVYNCENPHFLKIRSVKCHPSNHMHSSSKEGVVLAVEGWGEGEPCPDDLPTLPLSKDGAVVRSTTGLSCKGVLSKW
jgi:hypothetical protein